MPRSPPTPPIQASLNDEHLINMWIQGRAENTQLAYRRQIARFSAWLNHPLLEATVEEVQAYAHHVEGRGLALASQAQSLIAVRGFYGFALDVDAVPKNPARHLRPPKPRSKLAQRILSREDVFKLFEAARARIPTFPGETYLLMDVMHLAGYQPSALWKLAKEEGWRLLKPEWRTRQPLYQRVRGCDLANMGDRCPPFRDYVLVVFLYYSATRIAEATALRWTDIRTGDDGEARIDIFGKGSKSRTVVIPADVAALLCRLRQGGPDDGHVFRLAHNAQRALCTRHFTRTLHEIARRAHINVEVSPHWLRHSHCSHALDAGCPPHVVQATLGHSSLATTSLYAHCKPGESSARFLGGLDSEATAAGPRILKIGGGKWSA